MKNLFLAVFLFIFFGSISLAQTKKKPTPTAKPTPIVKPTPAKTPSKSVTKKIVDAVSNIFVAPSELSKFEKEVFDEINLARTHPQEYAKYLEEFLNTFDGKTFKDTNGVQITLNEGKKTIEEVIAVLKRMKPLPEYVFSEGLTKAAKDHAHDLSKNNITGHRGTDGSLPQNRVERYGAAGIVNENISYFAKTAREIVFNMLLDDGVASRNHRKNILSSNLKQIGLASGGNKEVDVFCIVVFTADFIKKK